MKFSVKNIVAWFLKRTLPVRIALVAAAVIVIGGGFFFLTSNQSTDGKLLTVKKGEFVQQVSASGKVVATNDVELGFEQAGRVDSILVEVNDKVSKGQRLATISLGTLGAELQAAQANLRIKQAEYENTGINLDEVKKQQDTAVASAYRTLLSSGLVAVPASGSYTVTPPIVSGVYLGAQEGVYKITIEHGPQQGTNFKLHYFGLENNLDTIISTKAPTPLGTRGLHVSFPAGASAYDGTSWYITLPNETGTNYVANYNAYQEALRARDKAIADAQAELTQRSEGITIAAATLDSARAEVARIQALIGERSINAPFSGIVSKVPASVGETVGVNQSVISMIGDGLFIETYIPEINISLLHVGNTAVVTLDAYGDTALFPATVVSIDPDQTVRDGVATYRIQLHFDQTDERIRSGMTANVLVTTEQKSGIISVPQGIVKGKGAKKTLMVMKNGKQEERTVTTGSVSALGNIEITSGLSEGEVVVLEK